MYTWSIFETYIYVCVIYLNKNIGSVSYQIITQLINLIRVGTKRYIVVVENGNKIYWLKKYWKWYKKGF